MAKKGDLAELLRGFSSGARADRQATGGADEAAGHADAGTARADKVPGILDPIMAQLTPEEQFQFLSGLMDFMGDFIVNMLDQYTFELGKAENSISNMQSTVLNQVRTIRNQVDIARQQGHFKQVEGPPAPMGLAGMFPGGKIAAAASAVGSSEEPKKRREATERDVMDIAASIRTLITRQKMAKPAAVQPAEGVPAPEQSPEAALEPTGKASLDTKLQQFQRSADEQKQRIERIASTAKPATKQAPSTSGQGTGRATGAKPSSRPKKEKPTAKPEAQPETGEAKTTVTKPAPIGMPRQEPKPPVKLDKEKDIMPKGFQQELMRNIKGLIKEKEKGAKKTPPE